MFSGISGLGEHDTLWSINTLFYNERKTSLERLGDFSNKYEGSESV